MKRTLPLLLLSLAALACSDGLAGPDSQQIAFTVTAPTEASGKAVIDVEARVIVAQRVQLPFTVVFEKANAGEPYFQVASLTLQGSERLAVARVPVLKDPMIRVTVRESSPAQFSVSKTIQVDVADYP